MKNHLGLRIALILTMAIGLGIMVVGDALSGKGSAQTPAANAIVTALAMSIFLPWILSVVFSGILAKKLKRDPGGWVLGAIFIPYIVPFFLLFMKEKPISVNRPLSAQAASSSDPEFKGFNEQGFCYQCVSETSDESPGNVSSFNGIGTALMGTRWSTRGLDPCPACGSVVQGKWRIFGFGVSKIGTYRIIYTKRGLTSARFFGRRLLSDFEVPAP